MKENKTPNWILFLFFGSLIGGTLYSIFLHGFLNYDSSHAYRTAAGKLYIEPKLSVIPARTQKGIQSGKENFQSVCAACHGVYGQYKPGLVGPNLADAQWLHKSSEKAMGRLVIQGVPAPASITGQVMPARGGASLSDTAVWEVIYYLSAKNRSIAKDAVPPE